MLPVNFNNNLSFTSTINVVKNSKEFDKVKGGVNVIWNRKRYDAKYREECLAKELERNPFEVKGAETISENGMTMVIKDGDIIWDELYGWADEDKRDEDEAHPEYSKEKIYTEKLTCCTAFAVVKPEEIGALVHYNRFPTKLKKCINEMKETYGENIRGFITGGDKYSNDEHFKSGLKFYKNIPTTILWGRKSFVYGSACYDVKKDTWHVLLNDEKDIKTPDDVKEACEFIHIAKGDELCIDDKPIDSEIVKQMNKEFAVL